MRSRRYTSGAWTMPGRVRCPYCCDTGRITIEMPTRDGDNMVQYEQLCECQIEGTAAYDRRIEFENHLAAGLIYSGKDEDGELMWLGTDQNWKKYEL